MYLHKMIDDWFTPGTLAEQYAFKEIKQFVDEAVKAAGNEVKVIITGSADEETTVIEINAFNSETIANLIMFNVQYVVGDYVSSKQDGGDMVYSIGIDIE